MSWLSETPASYGMEQIILTHLHHYQRKAETRVRGQTVRKMNESVFPQKKSTDDRRREKLIHRQGRIDHLRSTANPLLWGNVVERFAMLVDRVAVCEDAVVARVEHPVGWLRRGEGRQREQLVPDDVVREVVHVLGTDCQRAVRKLAAARLTRSFLS